MSATSALVSIEILHVDAHCVVVCKPSGLLSVPGRGDDKQDCVAERLRARYADVLIVHRLDMATSGLMLLARGANAQRRLSIAFAQREVHKRYVAIVAGRIETREGEIDLPLAADWPNRPRQQVDTLRGKPSLTRYRVIEVRDATTRVELDPLTGRAHQLRVHLLSIGHPILGDALYASPEVQAAAPRLLLHASMLQFVHPASGEPMRFDSTPPF